MEYLPGGAGFDHFAAAHYVHAVGEVAYEAEVVGYEQDAQLPLLADAGQEGQHLGLGGLVYRGGGFVGHQDVRLDRQGASHADPLTLASGQAVGAEPGLFGADSHLGQHGQGRRAGLLARMGMPYPEDLRHRLDGPLPGIEAGIGILEDHLDPRPHLPRQTAPRSRQGLAVVPHLAGGGAMQGRQHFPHRGLARPALPHQADHLPPLDPDVHPVDRPERGRSAPEHHHQTPAHQTVRRRHRPRPSTRQKYRRSAAPRAPPAGVAHPRSTGCAPCPRPPAGSGRTWARNGIRPARPRRSAPPPGSARTRRRCPSGRPPPARRYRDGGIGCGWPPAARPP